jgi:hypothetical protein
VTTAVPALYDPQRHEVLTGECWDRVRVQSAIAAIAADALSAQRDGVWERHPLDGDSPGEPRSLYYGAAGVLWALSHLARVGEIAGEPRLAGWAAALPERYFALPDKGAVVPSYFLGVSGVLLVALREGGVAGAGDALFDVARRHLDHPTREAFLGSAGTLHASAFAWEHTRDERWLGVVRDGASALEAAWGPHPADRFDLWTQDLYGAQRRLLGASHGFAGNVHALLRAWRLLGQLDDADRRPLLGRASAALAATAVAAEGLASWPIAAGAAACLVQWCHGAPGMVSSFARAPAQPELDQTLARAGELIWRAGPLRKGAGLCHGTAGNGEAFLALFERTGDERWLDRARRFAMHALLQVEEARRRHGRGRHTLWTGDLGVAVYLRQCLEGEAGMPSLDF